MTQSCSKPYPFLENHIPTISHHIPVRKRHWQHGGCVSDRKHCFFDVWASGDGHGAVRGIIRRVRRAREHPGGVQESFGAKYEFRVLIFFTTKKNLICLSSQASKKIRLKNPELRVHICLSYVGEGAPATSKTLRK